MTRMSGPLKIKRPFEETTVASIDVSGSAKFAQGLSFTGEMVANGTVKAFGRMQVGSSAGDTSDVVLVRTLRVSGNATKQQTIIPQGSDIIDIKYFQQTPVAASAAAQINVLVGATAQDTRYALFANVSAQGYYTVPTSTRTSAWNSVSGAGCVIQVSVTAISGAIASGAQGKLQILYVKGQ